MRSFLRKSSVTHRVARIGPMRPSTALSATTRSTPLSSPIASMLTCSAAMRTAIPSCRRRSPRRKDGWSGVRMSISFSTSWNSGKKVVLVLQAPELPERMEGLIYDPTSAHANLPGLSREWWTRRTAYVRQHLQEIPPGVMIVDPANSFCDEAVCYAGQEEISYYFDDDHMSVAGAGIVADEILSNLGFPVGSYRRRGARREFGVFGTGWFRGRGRWRAGVRR